MCGMKRIFICLLISIGIVLGWSELLGASAQAPSNWMTTLAWSPYGTKIATGSQDGTIQVWDASTGQSLKILRQGGAGMVMAVVWHPDSNKLASGGLNQSLIIWDAATGQPTLTFQEQLPNYTAIAWNPDGTKIAGVNDGGLFQIWDAISGSLLPPIPSNDFSFS